MRNDIPDGLTLYDGFIDFFPYRPSANVLRLKARKGLFPKYRNPMGQKSPAYWVKVDILAFFKEHWSDLWPDHYRALQKAWGLCLKPTEPDTKKKNNQDKADDHQSSDS